jgi:hypothetical protein
MREFRIETDGLTIREVLEIEKLVRTLENVEDAKFTPFLPGTKQNRMMPPPQAALTTMHVLVRLAVKGVAIAAGQHLYKKLGEGIVDKAWDAVKLKLSGKSGVEVTIRLYGPDGELLKSHEGKR